MGHVKDNGKDNVSFHVKDNGQDKANGHTCSWVMLKIIVRIMFKIMVKIMVIGHLFMSHVEAGQQGFLPVHLNPLSVSSVRLQQT